MKPMDEHGEHLISEGYALKQEIATLQARLRKTEEELEGYFPKADQVEAIATPYGTVHRIIQEDIYLDPTRADEVMAMLGSQFPAHFTTAPCCRPTEECRRKLFSADSHLGHDLRGYLVIQRERHYAFSPGKRIIDIVPKRGAA